MLSMDMLNEAQLTFQKLETNAKDFHIFKILFHSCCESLASIFQLADGKFQNQLKDNFFPEIIKIIRENKFHNGKDAFRFGTTSISGTNGSITQVNGPLVIHNEGEFNFYGTKLPKGYLVFGDKGTTGFINTVHNKKETDFLKKAQIPIHIPPTGKFIFGVNSKNSSINTINYKENDILQTVPTFTEIKMRDLFDIKIKKKLKKRSIKDINKWQGLIINYNPITFLKNAINFYENVLNDQK